MLDWSVVEATILVFSVAELLAFGISGCGKKHKAKKDAKKGKKNSASEKAKPPPTLQTEGTLVEEDPDLRSRSNYHFEDKRAPEAVTAINPTMKPDPDPPKANAGQTQEAANKPLTIQQVTPTAAKPAADKA